MKTGWRHVSGSWYYLDDSGAMLAGLRTIENKQYYFDNSSAMQMGWKTISEDTYFFANSGESKVIRRRALILGETSTTAVPIADVNTMEHVFTNQKINPVVRFPDHTKAEIIEKMEEIFRYSTDSDINYIYISCHGGADGSIFIGSDNTTFSGRELSSIPKKYKGKFVLMLDCCHAGTVIDKDSSVNPTTEVIEGEFDIDEFLSEIINLPNNEKSGEMIDDKFLVLCSSSQDETSSGGTLSLATKYWAIGILSKIAKVI